MRVSLAAGCAAAALVLSGGIATARPLAAEHRVADAADMGFLDVTSDPPAKVLVDEVDTGKTTPAQHLPLKVGHHKLTLVTPDGSKKRTIGFTIEAGQTTKLSIHLAS